MKQLTDIFRLIAIAAIATVAVCPPVHALIVDNGQSNTSAPFAEPGWSNIGTINNGTGIYLGNRWVLTAAHVTLAEPFIVDGQSYNYSAGPIIQNPDGSQADLRLLRLHQDPGLPMITIRKTEIEIMDQVVMISEGIIAGDTFHINSYTGYEWSDIRDKLWGENEINGLPTTPYESFGRDTDYFTTMFNKGPQSAEYEAQAANNDSGGGLFITNDQDDYELAGMIIAIKSGLGEKATFNFDLTYAADLVTYRHEIMSAMHLPGDANRDNIVGLLDLDILGQNYNQTGMVWEDGDFNGDGLVGLLDLDILGAHFGQSSLTLEDSAGQSEMLVPDDNTVPEPGVISLLLAASGLLISRRW